MCEFESELEIRMTNRKDFDYTLLQHYLQAGEGLYDAFKTAYNAKRAIVENKPFSETNREVFRKMKNEEKLFRLFFSPMGFRLVRFSIRHPRLTKWIFDAKMKRETFTPNHQS